MRRRDIASCAATRCLGRSPQPEVNAALSAESFRWLQAGPGVNVEHVDQNQWVGGLVAGLRYAPRPTASWTRNML